MTVDGSGNDEVVMGEISSATISCSVRLKEAKKSETLKSEVVKHPCSHYRLNHQSA
jgi:hypothetical protein